MTKISIMYPGNKGRFDIEYYIAIHMPKSIELLSAHPGYRGVSVERGIAGGAPGTEPAYVAMCHYLFDTLEDFVTAFSAHAALLQADMPNYTDIQPVIQASDVAISA